MACRAAQEGRRHALVRGAVHRDRSRPRCAGGARCRPPRSGVMGGGPAQAPRVLTSRSTGESNSVTIKAMTTRASTPYQQQLARALTPVAPPRIIEGVYSDDEHDRLLDVVKRHGPW